MKKKEVTIHTFGGKVRLGKMNSLVSECFGVKPTFWMRL